MRKLSLVASLAVLLASQGCTFTIPSALLNGGLVKPVAQGGGGSANPGCKPAFDKIDFDKDGAISPKEWEQSRILSSLDPMVIDVSVDFKTRDTNGDGKISFEEFGNACKPVATPGKPEPGAVEPPVGVKPGRPTKPPMPVEQPEPMCSKEAAETVANYDQDGNGSLSYEEFAPWYDEKTAELLGDCGVDYAEPGDDEGVYEDEDMGDDGEVTNWTNGGREATVGLRRLSPVVSNNGGGLISNNGSALIGDSPACPSYPEAELAFKKADADGSGELTADEICRFPFFFDMPTPPLPPVMPQPEPYPVDGCKGSFLKSDINGDGGVTPEEFFRTRIQPAIPEELVRMIGANQAMIAKMPANDGGLLKAEFAKRDANGDGRIDAGEWCGEVTPKPEPQPQPGNCDISAMDRNRDGFVSWEEFFGHNTAMIKIGQEGMARLKEELNAKFQVQDRNKDGQLDGRELCGDVVVDPKPPVLGDSGECGKLFDQYDLDHNNQIGFNEYADVKWKQMVFIKAPTEEEAAAAKKRFMDEAQKYDTDQNGRLSFVEFLNTCPNYVDGSVATTNR